MECLLSVFSSSGVACASPVYMLASWQVLVVAKRRVVLCFLVVLHSFSARWNSEGKLVSMLLGSLILSAVAPASESFRSICTETADTERLPQTGHPLALPRKEDHRPLPGKVCSCVTERSPQTGRPLTSLGDLLNVETCSRVAYVRPRSSQSDPGGGFATS